MSMRKAAQRLYYFPKPTRWSRGIGAELPNEYKKFWREWKVQQPTAVHYIKQEGSYIRNEETEEVKPVQNVPIRLTYPKEINEGIWGGEAIVQGFLKKDRLKRRVPHFWYPTLKRSVVYSEVLDTYMRTVITTRTIHLIHEHYGFDHYLLKTPACDLRSELALKIKREILVALADKTLYPNDKTKREEIYNKYKQYLSAYTRDEIEWYGLTYKEACKKWITLNETNNKIEPLKIQYRAELIANLKEKKPEEWEESTKVEIHQPAEKSWIAKLNPFSKSTKSQ